MVGPGSSLLAEIKVTSYSWMAWLGERQMKPELSWQLTEVLAWSRWQRKKGLSLFKGPIKVQGEKEVVLFLIFHTLPDPDLHFANSPGYRLLPAKSMDTTGKL